MNTAAPTLQGLIAPLPLSEFLSQALHKRAVHVTGHADRHQPLFSSDALEALANTGPTASHVRLYRSDVGFVQATSAAQVVEQLSHGAAVVVEGAEHYSPRLGALADRLSAELDEPSRVNVYATSPSAPGFPLHADTHDVLVLQIEGEKRWTVSAPTLSDPLFHPSLHPQTAPTEDKPYLDVALNPGDTLYIPRGHWHQAQALGGPSLHLTVALFAATGVDVMHYLVDRMHGSAVARAPFPVSPGLSLREASSVPQEHHDHLQSLRDELSELLGQPSFLADFRRWRMAHRSLRQPVRVMQHLRAEPVRGPVRVRAVGGWVAEEEGGVSVHIPGRVLWFPRGTLAVLRRLWSGEVCTADELAELTEPSDPGLAQRIVDGLLAQGILIPAR